VQILNPFGRYVFAKRMECVRLADAFEKAQPWSGRLGFNGARP
jgi:hypothetical protein